MPWPKGGAWVRRRMICRTAVIVSAFSCRLVLRRWPPSRRATLAKAMIGIGRMCAVLQARTLSRNRAKRLGWGSRMVGKGRQRRSTVKIPIKGRAGGCQLSFFSLQNLRFAFPLVQRYRRSFRCCRYGNRANFARTGTFHRRLDLRDYAPHVGVGRPDVQGFVGSLVGFSAIKGVFVTTSHLQRPCDRLRPPPAAARGPDRRRSPRRANDRTRRGRSRKPHHRGEAPG